MKSLKKMLSGNLLRCSLQLSGVRVLLFVLFLSVSFCAFADYQSGDTITIGTRKFKLQSANLITNPGFEDGFTGWTDGTLAAATLTSEKFVINETGGVNNSKYIVGTTNESAASAGSIGTGWPVSSGKSYLFSFQVKNMNAAAAASTDTYTRASLTNDKTSSGEPKLLISSASIGANGAWTQNFSYFTNTNPVYSYIQVRFRWLNNRVGYDDFMLFEAVEVANNVALQTAINDALALYNANTNGAAAFLAAIETAKSYLPSLNSTEVSTAITNLQKAVQTYKYAIVTPDQPLDMTSFLANPGFNDNTTTGWQGAGTVGSHAVEFYEKTFNMYQVVTGLPAGKYRLKAKGFERPKANDAGAAYKAGKETIYAKLYAGAPAYTEVNVPFNSLYKHTYTGTGSASGYVNTMAAAEIVFTNTTTSYFDIVLDGILLNEGGALTVGAKSSFQQSGYWALFDNFKLEYLGPAGLSDQVQAVKNRIVEAQSYLSKHIQNSATSSLNAAILQAQTATSADTAVEADITAAKTVIDAAITSATTSVASYASLQKALTDAKLILTFLDKDTEITKLQNAITVATADYDNLDLTSAQLTSSINILKTTTKSVGKQIYIPTWMMGDVNSSTNNWSYDRSKQSKNWILFWEPGFGDTAPSIADDCLNLAEKCFAFYADSLKFIKRGASKTDTYKMIIRLRYTTEWEATGSGVDNTIGLLTLTSWALTSRGGQTIAHEVGHCFQYQTHCDNNNNNGWMYGYGTDASGSNGWWEQCAQWQAYKVFPAMQLVSSNEWMSGYLANTNKNLLNEAYRYNDFFIQDYWCYLHGMDIIGILWNKSVKPEDPVEAYKRLTAVSQSKFNDEMWDCGARFATWDIPALKTYGASMILSRPQPKLVNTGNNIWRIDSTSCLENYGHNIIRVNAPTTAKTISVAFEGIAGSDGYRKNYVAQAGWRVGFVALLKDGTRVYGNCKGVTMGVKAGKDTVSIDCPANCDKLWLVVSGAPSTHWRHAWDDNDGNDEQWPYKFKFNNTNVYGYANVVDPNFVGLEDSKADDVQLYTSASSLHVSGYSEGATLRVADLSGRIVLEDRLTGNDYSHNLSAGIYLINIRSDKGILNRKIIIR